MIIRFERHALRRRIAGPGLIALCAALGPSVNAPNASEPPLSGPVAAQVLRVIDGDTIEVSARIWLRQEITIHVRLLGIDAPELSRARCPSEKERAEAARDRLADLVGAGPVRLFDIDDGKYADRVLAHVRTQTGSDIGETLLREGLARPYIGGRRQDWCG